MKKKRLIKIASFIAVTTVVVHFINKHIESNALLKRLLRKTEEDYFDWKLGRIHYTVSGSGSPLLLIHDLMPGSSLNEWNSIKDSLSINHTVYAIDLLGCGLSEKIKMSYTNYLYVQLLDDFINEVIGEKTDVISSGLSGSVVLMKHLNNSENIGKIIMINPPAIPSVSNAPSWKETTLITLLKIPVFGTLLYNMIVSRENICSIFMDQLFYNPFMVEDIVIDSYYESAHKDTSAAKDFYISLLSKYINAPISNALKSIESDVYIIEGSEETNSSSVINSYCSINDNIVICNVDNTKHLPHLEDPAQLIKILKTLNV